jgi:hypothetical protein
MIDPALRAALAAADRGPFTTAFLALIEDSPADALAVMLARQMLHTDMIDGSRAITEAVHDVLAKYEAKP